MLESLIFSNQRSYTWVRHVLFWLAWLVFFTYIYAQKFGNLSPAWAYGLSAVEAVIYLPIHMALSYMLIYWIIPDFLLKSRYVLAFLITCVALVVAAMASHYTTLGVISPLRIWWRDLYRPGLPLPHVSASAMYGLMAGLRGANTVAGFAGTIKLLKYWYQKKKENELLQKEKLSAELNLLKAQLHPHFLFNTLNNLYSHIINHSQQSGDIVLKLSDMLNYMLYECAAEKVSLEGEVRMLKNYVDLEKLRYGDRLDVSFKVAGVDPSYVVSPLLLLPFVENAFKHGASQELDQAWISVSLAVQGNELSVKVINPVPVSANHSRKETGIGLANVRRRLNALYPDSHTLKITQDDELFVVVLKLPLQTVLLPQSIT